MTNYLRLEGIVTSKNIYTGDKENHPAGYISVEDKSLAIWNKNSFEKLIVGDNYVIEYTKKEWNDKVYYSAIEMTPCTTCIDETKITFSEDEKEELRKVGVTVDDVKSPKNEIELIGDEVVVVGGFKYKVIPTRLELVAT